MEGLDRSATRETSSISMPLSRSLAVSFVPLVLFVLACCGCRTHTHRSTTTMRWSSDGLTRTIEMRGSIEFADDDRDVKVISPGGSLSIEDGNWLMAGRSYVVRANSDGSLSRTYTVEGKQHTIDKEAQAWIGGAVLSLIRESGLGMSQRVERFLAKGGPAAVLREVAQIRSDGSKRMYLQELVESARLTNDDLRDVMRSARSIGSDGDKTNLLIDVSRSYRNDDVRESWFTTLSGVGSDGDKRRALEHVIANDGDTGNLAMAARLAGDIGSDGDKAAVLSAIGAKGVEQPSVRGPWFRSVKAIGSDGDKTRVLASVLGESVADESTIVEILRTAETIGSDGDKARLLAQAVHSNLRSETVQRAFLATAGTIGSDGDRKNVLTALLNAPSVDSSIVTLVAESTKAIGSDGDKAAVLSRVPESATNDAASRAAFFAAVNSIGSDGDKKEVLKKLLSNSSVNPDTAVAAIDGAMRIGSDGDKASLLMLAAERHGSNPAVRASLEKALRSIGSDADYRRVAEALRR